MTCSHRVPHFGCEHCIKKRGILMSDFKNNIFLLRSIRHDLEELIEEKFNGSIANPEAVKDINGSEYAICISKSSEIDKFNKEFDELIDKLDSSINSIERTCDAPVNNSAP